MTASHVLSRSFLPRDTRSRSAEQLRNLVKPSFRASRGSQERKSAAVNRKRTRIADGVRAVLSDSDYKFLPASADRQANRKVWYCDDDCHHPNVNFGRAIVVNTFESPIAAAIEVLAQLRGDWIWVSGRCVPFKLSQGRIIDLDVIRSIDHRVTHLAGYLHALSCRMIDGLSGEIKSRVQRCDYEVFSDIGPTFKFLKNQETRVVGLISLWIQIIENAANILSLDRSGMNAGTTKRTLLDDEMETHLANQVVHEKIGVAIRSVQLPR